MENLLNHPKDVITAEEGNEVDFIEYVEYGIFVGDSLKGSFQADVWTREKVEEEFLWRYGPEARILTRTVVCSAWVET